MHQGVPVSKILIVARREYVAMVATKGFLIGAALMPLLMVGGILVPRLLAKSVDQTDKRVAVIDQSGSLFEALAGAAAARNAAPEAEGLNDLSSGRYLVVPGPQAALDDQARLALSDQVRQGALYAFVEIPADILDDASQQARFHSEGSALSDVRQWFERTLQSIVQLERFRREGVDPGVVHRAGVRVAVEARGLYARDAAGAIIPANRTDRLFEVFLPSGVMMLMFVVIYMAILPMLECVLEEKQHRIAEVLLGSVTPLQLMAGKLLGNVAGSLTTMSIYAGGGVVLAWYYDTLERVPWRVVPWFLLFQLLAVVMYSAIVMALAAAANNLHEAQGYLIFVWLPLMLPMFAWFNIVREPNGQFATMFSFFLPATPMIMVLRLAASTAVPGWQVACCTLLVVFFALAVLWAASRVFRVALLAQGKAPRLAELARWALHG
jgi:ABC-2 type transport system permease protein